MQLHNKMKIRKIGILEIRRIGEENRSERMKDAGAETRRNKQQQILGSCTRSTEKQTLAKIQQRMKDRDLATNAKREEKTDKDNYLVKTFNLYKKKKKRRRRR